MPVACLNCVASFNPCIKYCRRRCGDTNSTTVWHDQNMYVIQGGHNSALMFWIKILIPLCTIMFNAYMNVLQVLNPCIKYCRRRCGDKNSSTVWYGPKYICHSMGHNSAIMIWIKILFPICTCPMHVLTVLHVSNPCMKYCRRIGRKILRNWLN